MNCIRIDRQNGMHRLRINHPPLNVLTKEVMRELTGALRETGADTRAVALSGEGSHFSAGADVGEHLPGRGEGMLEAFEDLCLALDNVPAPTVAIVRGSCLGGGFEIALGCDLLLASEDARLGLPEITLGVLPPAAAAALPARIGPARAADLILTGRILDGREAAAWGIATRAVPPSDLDKEAESLLARLVSFSAAGLRSAKAALAAARTRPFRESLRETFRLYRERVLPSADGTEGLRSFLEKRKPVWSHR